MIVWFVFVLGALPAAGKLIVTQVNKSVTLDCGVSTFSRSLLWFHKDAQIVKMTKTRGIPARAPSLVRMSVKQETKLKIDRVIEADAGKFKCQADLHTFEFTLLVVSASVDPSGVLQLGSEAVLRCQVTGPDLGATVLWKTPAGQERPGSQEVQLKPVAALDEGIWQCVFNGGGETLSVNVNVQVEREKPLSPPVTTSIPESSNDSGVSKHNVGDGEQLLGLSWWAWLTLGAGCLVVTLLLVSVILLCQRVRRKRRKFRRMKNAPQPLRPKTYCQCDRPTAAPKPQQGRRREKPSALPL